MVGSKAILGNFLIMYITAIFGSKHSLFVSVSFYVLGSLCFLGANGFFMLSIGALFYGFNDQFISILLKIIMNELFGADFTHFLPICYAGFAFSSLIWPNVLSVIANPDNVPPNVPFEESGQTVLYFSKDIVANFQLFMKFQLAVHVILMTIMTVFFTNPSLKKGKVSAIMKRLTEGNFSHASVIIQHRKLKQEQRSRKIDKDYTNGVKHVSFIQSISRTFSLAPKYRKMSAEEQVSLPFNHSQIEVTEHRHPSGDATSIDRSGKKEHAQNLDNESPMFEMIEINKQRSYGGSDPDLKRAGTQPQISPATKRLEDKFGPLETDPANNNQPKLVREKLTIEQKGRAVEEYRRNENRRQKGAKEYLYSLNFLFIVLMCTVRTTTGRYYMSNFKIMGLFYFKDDTLINTIGSLVFAGYILMTFTFGYIYDLLGTKTCYKITFGLYIVGNLVYALAPANLFLFVTFSFVHRVSL